MLSILCELINKDPTKHGSKGHQILSEPPSELTYEHYRYTGEQAFREKFELDEDAIFDLVLYGGGGTSSPLEDVTVYAKTYIYIETNPNGDIAFHSIEPHKYGYNRVRDIVPISVWKDDKGSLENALGKTFNNPYSYSYQIETTQPKSSDHIPF